MNNIKKPNNIKTHKRRALVLPVELWNWLDKIAIEDQASWNDHVEGLILLAQDREEARR